MTFEWIVVFVVVGLLLVAVGKSATVPLRWAGLVAINLVVGAILLFFANLVGQIADFHVPINPVTALLAGFLRIPGLVSLVVIKLFIM
jgi:inhibitor of the pro-sigma K processing machinery